MKLQVYVETFEDGIGPIVVAQLVTPVTPVITHVPTAVGAFAPAGPVTVAVNVTVEPRAAVGALAFTATVGVDLPTVVVPPDVRADAK
jgi:hypothetical protein